MFYMYCSVADKNRETVLSSSRGYTKSITRLFLSLDQHLALSFSHGNAVVEELPQLAFS